MDKEFYIKRAEHMRSFIDYSRHREKLLDVTRQDMIKQIEKNVSFKGIRKTEIIRKVLQEAEKIQEESLIMGAKSVSTLNGKFVVEYVNEKPINNNINTDLKKVPPKYKINFTPGGKIKKLNKALKIMSFTKEEKG